MVRTKASPFQQWIYPSKQLTGGYDRSREEELKRGGDVHDIIARSAQECAKCNSHLEYESCIYSKDSRGGLIPQAIVHVQSG